VEWSEKKKQNAREKHREIERKSVRVKG
jgi:hypothetical protein